MTKQQYGDNNTANDINAVVHCIGNGRVASYGRGAEIFDMFGPFYSAPTMCTMELYNGHSSITSESEREHGTAIWTHRLYNRGEKTSDMLDYTDDTKPIFIREISAYVPASNKTTEWLVRGMGSGFSSVQNPFSAIDHICNQICNTYITTIPAGTIFYKVGENNGIPYGYPTITALTAAVTVTGDAQTELKADGLHITCTGKCTVIFSFEQSEAAALINLAEAASAGGNAILERCRQFWQNFTAARLQNRPASADSAFGDIEAAVDDIATLIKAQQGCEGGVLAGHNYHLSYIRDSFGTHRGLLAMGCNDEARQLNLYHADVFKRYGRLQNAQGIGTPAFHTHENDDVEITGYIVIMAMEYYAATGDEATLQAMLPLMRWCMDKQRAQLRNGALPFNGDETYIAGGVVPRTIIADGSMEATLLYYHAGKLMLSWLSALGVEDSWTAAQSEAMQDIKAHFAANFTADGKLYCNKPNFFQESALPLWRHGVQECGHGFGDSYCTGGERYVCINCYASCGLPAREPVRYELVSAALMPVWLGEPDLADAAILRPIIDRIYREWRTNGQLPSRPNGSLTVGYDYGLALTALMRCNYTSGESFAYDTAALARETLQKRDSSGAWVELYIDGLAMNTKCRPWESGINIAAFIEFMDDHMDV